MITAKVIADSISPDGIRLTTLQLHYPKFIHGEFLTHRLFSRNSSSSRAIPFEKFVKDIEEDMVLPVHWGKNQPGMQAREEIEEKDAAEKLWRNSYKFAQSYATSLHNLGVHKQICNRLVEPFYNINTVVTATEWDNFFELRLHPDAQPEIHELARCMKEAMDASLPDKIQDGEWHLPYVTDVDRALYATEVDDLIKASVARCARVSYFTHEGKPSTMEKDLELYDRLVGSKPLHASPAEHQATPDRKIPEYYNNGAYDACTMKWQYPHVWGNFKGWKQYRKILEREHGI